MNSTINAAYVFSVAKEYGVEITGEQVGEIIAAFENCAKEHPLQRASEGPPALDTEGGRRTFVANRLLELNHKEYKFKHSSYPVAAILPTDATGTAGGMGDSRTGRVNRSTKN